MKKLSYEEVYAEVHGSDLMTDIRDLVHNLLKEEEDMHTKLTIEKPLESSIMGAEFVEYNKEKLINYVIDRVHTIAVLMDKKLHLDKNNEVAMGARDIIFDTLKEIERVHPCIVEYIGEDALGIIERGQELFIKKLWI